MLTSIEIDGTIIPCKNSLPQIGNKRAKARKITTSAVCIENQLLHTIKRRCFNPNYSRPYTYLKEIMHETRLNADLFIGLAKLFSFMEDIPIQREYYRRKSATIYWLNIHFLQFRQFLSNHNIKVTYGQKEYQLE